MRWHCRCLRFFSHPLSQANFCPRFCHSESIRSDPASGTRRIVRVKFACTRTLIWVHTAAIVLIGKRPHKDSTHMCPHVQRRQHSLGPAITWWQERSGQLLDIKPTWRREEILLPSASRDLCRAQILTPPLTFHNRKEVDGWDTSPALGMLRRETVSRWTVLASDLLRSNPLL